MATHNDLGKLGEELAVQYLLNEGYSIVTRNYRYLKAEIDIIAQKNNVLAIVEVKTRQSSYFGNPQEFISSKKIKLLQQAAHEYVVTNDLDVEVRFDIVAILKNKSLEEIDHITNAFFPF